MKKLLLLILSAVMLTMCLTACGDSSDTASNSSSLSSSEKYYKLQNANKLAKAIYISINANAEALYENGDTAIQLKTDGIIDVESFKDSTNTLEKAVYNEFKSYEDKGYVYIDYDPSANQSFVQWSEDKNGTVVGQYPHSVTDTKYADKIKFIQNESIKL